MFVFYRFYIVIHVLDVLKVTVCAAQPHAIWTIPWPAAHISGRYQANTTSQKWRVELCDGWAPLRTRYVWRMVNRPSYCVLEKNHNTKFWTFCLFSINVMWPRMLQIPWMWLINCWKSLLRIQRPGEHPKCIQVWTCVSFQCFGDTV